MDNFSKNQKSEISSNFQKNHSNSGKSVDEEDPLEKLLKGTGCLEKHYKVQNCIAETADWRKCQKEVEDFRICFEEHKKSQQEKKHLK